MKYYEFGKVTHHPFEFSKRAPLKCWYINVQAPNKELAAERVIALVGEGVYTREPNSGGYESLRSARNNWPLSKPNTPPTIKRTNAGMSGAGYIVFVSDNGNTFWTVDPAEDDAEQEWRDTDRETGCV